MTAGASVDGIGGITRAIMGVFDKKQHYSFADTLKGLQQGTGYAAKAQMQMKPEKQPRILRMMKGLRPLPTNSAPPNERADRRSAFAAADTRQRPAGIAWMSITIWK